MARIAQHEVLIAEPRFFYGFTNGLCDFIRQFGFYAKADGWCFVELRINRNLHFINNMI